VDDGVDLFVSDLDRHLSSSLGVAFLDVSHADGFFGDRAESAGCHIPDFFALLVENLHSASGDAFPLQFEADSSPSG
jgi:hypothetical protein